MHANTDEQQQQQQQQRQQERVQVIYRSEQQQYEAVESGMSDERECYLSPSASLSLYSLSLSVWGLVGGFLNFVSRLALAVCFREHGALV